jgi:hypothetical protein
MPKGLGKFKEHFKRHEDDLIDRIKQILNESIDASSLGEKDELVNEIKKALSESFKKILDIVETDASLVPADQDREAPSYISEREESKSTPFDCHKLRRDWKKHRTKIVINKETKEERWQDAKEYLDATYGEKEKQKYGTLYLFQLRKINPKLTRSLETLASRKGERASDYLPTKYDLVEKEAISIGEGYVNLPYREGKRMETALRRVRQRQQSSKTKDNNN